MINHMRDSVLRIIAQRRQIVVPSLFADYDPDALERRLIPLAAVLESAGLAALGSDARYEIDSDLYSAGRVIGGGRIRGESEDTAAIGAASAAAQRGAER
jgi:hypothetical protein